MKERERESAIYIMNLSAGQETYATSCRILGTTTFVIIKLPSEKLLVNHILAIAVNGILIIPTILLNAVAIITIWKSSQLSRKPCYFIILVQSVTDLAVGFVGLPLFIFYLKSGIGGDANHCTLVFLTFRLTLLPAGLSSITLIALTLERYIAILHPYSYCSEVTKKRLLLFIGCFDALEILVLAFSLYSRRFLEIYVEVKVTFALMSVVFTYTRIYLVVRKIARSQCKPQDPSSEENLTRMKLFLREIKQAKACFIVVIYFFVLSFLPATIAIPFFPMLDMFEELAVRVWVVTLGLLNSSANSVVFFWAKTMLKKEAVKMVTAMMSW